MLGKIYGDQQIERDDSIFWLIALVCSFKVKRELNVCNVFKVYIQISFTWVETRASVSFKRFSDDSKMHAALEPPP